MTSTLANWIALISWQISTFEAAKDWIVIGLIGVVGTLLGMAWADVRGKIAALDARLDRKIATDLDGYQRLTRCEARLDSEGGREGREEGRGRSRSQGRKEHEE